MHCMSINVRTGVSIRVLHRVGKEKRGRDRLHRVRRTPPPGVPSHDQRWLRQQEGSGGRDEDVPTSLPYFAVSKPKAGASS